jgi:hypothetical protein
MAVTTVPQPNITTTRGLGIGSAVGRRRWLRPTAPLGLNPAGLKKALEATCPFHEDCTTIRGYIRDTLGQQGKI